MSGNIQSTRYCIVRYLKGNRPCQSDKETKEERRNKFSYLAYRETFIFLKRRLSHPNHVWYLETMLQLQLFLYIFKMLATLFRSELSSCVSSISAILPN